MTGSDTDLPIRAGAGTCLRFPWHLSLHFRTQKNDMQRNIHRASRLSAVQQALSESPVVALLGARQVGKTTLAREVLAGWDGPTTVFDLERAAAREGLSRTPERVLRAQEGLVVIDEIQRLPRLFEVLRPVSDDPDRRAAFLILGSASPTLVRGVSETLAGRVLFVDLGGFSLEEVGAHHLDRLWLRGGFPPAFLATTGEGWSRWMDSFSRTFLERDLPLLDERAPPEAVGRLWRMLAHFHGQSWNAAELARSLDVRPNVVNRYRDLLAGAFLIRVLRPWFENLGKRLVKSPKVYLRDSGVLHHLLDIEDEGDLPLHPRYGASWEGFALEQTLLAHGERGAYFYRTQRGAELDLLLFRRGRRWGFEFKCTDAPRTTKSMRTVMADLGLERLFAVYPGETEYPLDDRITALPLTRVGALDLRPES